jgi:hypothetical protein
MGFPDGTLSGALEAKTLVYSPGNCDHSSYQYLPDCDAFDHPDELAQILGFLARLDPEAVFLRGDLPHVGGMGGKNTAAKILKISDNIYRSSAYSREDTLRYRA